MQTSSSDSPHNDPSESEFYRNRSLVLIACLLATVGGYLDAYAYLAHGRVFANAQTGNVVFLGVYASAGLWAQAARHVPPR